MKGIMLSDIGMYDEGGNRIRIHDKLCCTVANEYQDDLIDDRARKVRKVVETSTISTPKTVMAWRRH